MSKKIVFFSDLYLPTFPFLELPMYREAEKRGIDVVYVLQNGDIRLTDKKLAKTFNSLNLKTIEQI